VNIGKSGKNNNKQRMQENIIEKAFSNKIAGKKHFEIKANINLRFSRYHTNWV
jgi:hypothetical protein